MGLDDEAKQPFRDLVKSCKQDFVRFRLGQPICNSPIFLEDCVKAIASGSARYTAQEVLRVVTASLYGLRAAEAENVSTILDVQVSHVHLKVF